MNLPPAAPHPPEARAILAPAQNRLRDAGIDSAALDARPGIQRRAVDTGVAKPVLRRRQDCTRLGWMGSCRRQVHSPPSARRCA